MSSASQIRGTLMVCGPTPGPLPDALHASEAPQNHTDMCSNPEEHTDPHIVNSALHCPIHGLCGARNHSSARQGEAPHNSFYGKFPEKGYTYRFPLP